MDVQVPNGNFENWKTTSRDTLVGWKGTLGVQKIIGSNGTGYAAKIVTTSVSDLASIASGSVSCIVGCSGQIIGSGIPLNGATGKVTLTADFASTTQGQAVAVGFFDANGLLMSGGINGLYAYPISTLTNGSFKNIPISSFIASTTSPFPIALNVPTGAASMLLAFFSEVGTDPSKITAKTVGTFLSIDNLIVKVGSTALTVNNSNFENWSTIVTDEASGWNSSETYMTGSLSKSTDKNSGTYAAKISTGKFAGNIQSGVLSYGTVQYGNTEAENIYSPKWAINAFVDKIHFSYKYLPALGISDSAEVEIIFTERVNNKTQKTASFSKILAPSNTYIIDSIQFPNKYSVDSVIVQFYSSRGTGTINRGVGSVLMVDDIYFVQEPDAIKENLLTDLVKLSPNPTTDIVTIYNNQDELITVGIKNLSGNLVSLFNVEKNSTYKFNLSSYPKGVYLVEITTLNSKIVKKLILE